MFHKYNSIQSLTEPQSTGAKSITLQLANQLAPSNDIQLSLAIDSGNNMGVITESVDIKSKLRNQ